MLLKQDRNKHQWRRLLLQRPRYHVICVFGLTWNQVRTTRAVSKCKKDDQVAYTRSFSASRRRRSSRIQNLGTDVTFRIYIFTAMVNSKMAELLAKREEDLRRDSSIVWIHSFLIPSSSFEQFKSTPEVGSSHDTHSITQSGSIPGGKDVKQGRHAVFSTAVIPMYIDHYREKDHDVIKCTNNIGRCTKPQCIGVIWGLLRWKDCSSINRDQTRSSFNNSLPAMCTERVVVRMSGEELHNNTFQSPIAAQRKVVKASLNYERQDTASSDARTSFDHSDKHRGTYTDLVAVK